MPGQCKIAAALLCALILVGLDGSAVAQAYPTRAVTIITPSLPGGGIDITARQIAAELQASPAGTPKPVVDRLSGAIKTIVERPDFKARVEKSGATIYYMGPEQLTEYTKQEVAHWREVVRNLGIPAQTQ